jgi:protein-S-isoprenylcysteine O-methyltransferase Ste14
MYALMGILWALFYGYWWYASRQVRRTTETESEQSRFVHTGLMILAYALALAVFIPLGPLDDRFLPDRLLLFWLGIAIEIGGIAFAVWARLHLGEYWSGRVTLKEGHRLIRTGPYAIVRNPIYTGIFVGMVGTAIALGEWRGLVAVAVILVAVWRKIAIEETYLSRQFGAEYDQYRHDVKALIPFVV